MCGFVIDDSKIFHQYFNSPPYSVEEVINAPGSNKIIKIRSNGKFK